MKTISEKKLNHYFDLTEKALKKIKIKIPDNINLDDVANDLLDLSQRYKKDAYYFKKKGDYVNAFAAINYSHAFLDVGARIKVFDVKDNKLFMVDEE